MLYIFMDESGQFNKRNNENYFVVTSLTTEDPLHTAKQFRSWMKSRFPKRMKNQSEIKWSDSTTSNSLRLRTLRFIARLGVRIRLVYLLCENIPYGYHTKKGLESGLLYAHVVEKLLEMYLPTDDDQLLVFCDKRHLKGLRESEFKNILETRLLAQMSPQGFVKVSMVDSTTNINVQIADWIAGAFRWYLEKRPLGEDCYSILKDSMADEAKEVFPLH